MAAAGRLSGLDRISDREFRRLVPEAADSWIILDPARARIIRVTRAADLKKGAANFPKDVDLARPKGKDEGDDPVPSP